MLSELPIETDCVELFRTALDHDLSADVAREGTIAFLETKVFDRDYLAFLDDCANMTSYSQARRETAARRKRALERTWA